MPAHGPSGALILAVGAYIASVFGFSAETARAQLPPIPVEVATIVVRNVADEVSFVATLEPNVATKAGAVVSGRVIASDLREGDRVVAHKTILVQLDRTSREIGLREAEAAVEKARHKWEELRRGYRAEEVTQRRAEVEEQQAVLERAENDYARAERLYRDQFISLADTERLKSEFLAAREKHKRLRAALEMAESGPRKEEIAQAEAEYREAQARRDLLAYDLDRTALPAPITGYVVKKYVEAGTWVNPGDPILDIVDLDPIFATGPVGERKIDQVKKGLSAEVILDALPGQIFQGTVAHIVPQADPQSRTFPVKINIANPQGRLKGGMLARVTIRGAGERSSLLVPKDAVVRKGSEEIVYVVEGDTANAVRVKTGRVSQGFVEVWHDSLRAGQEVVVLGNELLADGAKIRKISAREKPVAPRRR